MQNSWKELSKTDKKLYIVAYVFVILGLVCAILDLCNAWAYAHLCWCLCFAAYLGFEAKISWNRKRSLATLQWACSGVLLILSIIDLIK